MLLQSRRALYLPRWPKNDPDTVLLAAQKTLGGVPSVSLTIGSEALDPYLLAYHYEEMSEERGYLALWLDNRADQFDNLATDWPTLVRGAAVELGRGLLVEGTAYQQQLPRCWVESLEYTDEGTLQITCIDWWGKLETFRYADDTEFSTDQATTAASVLAQVGLSLAAGSFGYSADYTASKYDDGDELLQEIMAQCHEVLYTGLSGEIQWKQLDPAESAGYAYDFQHGAGGNHPLLPDTTILDSSPRFNKVTVIGGTNLQYTATAGDAGEIALTGPRLLTHQDPGLSVTV